MFGLFAGDHVFRLTAVFAGIVLMFMAFLTYRRGSRIVRDDIAEISPLRRVIQTMLLYDGDIAFLTSANGDILYRNPAAITRFGDISDGHLGSAIGQIVATPDLLLAQMREQATAYGAATQDVATRTGQYRLTHMMIEPDLGMWRLNDQGRNSQSLGRAADMLTLPMLTAGPSDAVLYMNEVFRKLLGNRPKSLSEIFGATPPVSGRTCEVRTTSGPQTFIAGVVDRTAQRREIYLLPTARDATGPTGTVGLSAGWDEIEDLPVPLLKICRDGMITASNRQARVLLGFENNDERRVQDVLDGLGRPISDWIKEAIAGQGGHVSQFLRGRGENQETFVQVTLNIADGPEGRHLIAVLNDVTELKTLEAQFVQSQKMQAIGQLAGGVAHDFNNLLTAISGHCDLLLLRHDAGDHDYGDLIQIHQNANRAASLVGQLLAFSRKQNLQPERIDLRDTLSDLTHLLNRLVGERVSLILEHDPDLAAIKADKRQLEQVMMNLVVNARDAMPQGGEIRIVTENRQLDVPLVRGNVSVPPGAYVVVRVIDEGCGIVPERLPKVFEPFYTTKRTGEGTGLGLSTAYGIVKQTGGFIFAHSEVGSGTEFEMLFPSQTRPVADTRRPPNKGGDQIITQGSGVVLLVEDEAPVRAFASRALRLRGYTVIEADCAEAALDLLSDPDLKVDLFLSDVIMPGLDGPTWVKQARVARPDTKVIFVSGYAEDAFNADNDRIANAVFLPKPFSLNALTETVQAQLLH
ncbi:two-component system, cell cycle sensor histidine kinase and response regulator CckA [Loktanella sp. DSM 29012]|uniref:ATP-binding protein n=1 Tax=Loktanella sp. DSM 29012 TaxID=1881056 RepID=UPI0008C6EC76|nr:ATP-binding protein [Loktanella sp. DSM 29012]SEP93480.1 two-component system, cell cycle sensor histidine kinase and response regulator CckA [Loktanella sp. DSM 29012]